MNKPLSVFANPFVDVSPNIQLRSIPREKELKTDGSNFTTWFCTLRIILALHRMGYVLDATIGDAPKEGASNDEKAVYLTKVEGASFVHSGMLYAMEFDLQKRFEKMSAFEIIINLKAIFPPQAQGEVRGFRAVLLLPYG
jgi:hypothetical protein